MDMGGYMELSKKIVENVKKEIIKKFPEMAQVEPTCVSKTKKVSPELLSKLKVSFPKAVVGEEVFVLSFRKMFSTTDGFKITKIVKATVDRHGKLLKTIVSK